MNILKLIIVLTILLPLSLGAVTQQDVVGFWTFNLEPGFNLVTFPLLPDNPTIQNVIGDRLSNSEISTWDNRLERFRYSKFDSESGRWSGDLFILNRGTAYWINIVGEDPKQMVLTGKPEQYIQFNWTQLDHGWNFYAPTIGKSESLSDLPPAHSDDLLIGWNSQEKLFNLIEAKDDSWSIGEFEELSPDRGYIVYLNRRIARQVGPPTRPEMLYQPTDGSDVDGGNLSQPPRPLIVSNDEGLPVCNPDGGVCNGGFLVQVIRDGEIPQIISEQFIVSGNAETGRFQMVLTVSPNGIQPDDQVYLLIKGQGGAETRSISFTIPSDEQFVSDVSFPLPMSQRETQEFIPAEFSLGSPYPNPFNDRFQVELQLPKSGNVIYALYDIQGRQALSFDEKKLSAGVHRLSITASQQLSTGIYFLEIKTGSERGLAKIAYIR